MKLLKGNIIHAPTLEKLETIENGALLLEDDGTIREVLHAAPQDFDGRVYDCSGQLIMQSFADMHLHAPQFPNVGMGMDLPLLDWLKTYTFPVEAKFADLDYARRIYRRLAHDLIANGTTRVCMFSSLHTDATLVLMEELENAGVTGLSARSTWTATAVKTSRRPPRSPSAKRAAGLRAAAASALSARSSRRALPQPAQTS